MSTSKQVLAQEVKQQNCLRFKAEGSLQEALKHQKMLKINVEV